ncbi:hypothetical protein [Consotaella salsifontis]|uniref:Uncharacterized protein n=1 Tax=Consotaella salsifontis TaxID=1365950 RepID=A0A1T4PUA1_9HYPH|nr:hypothetical protein [Consotaella salsifontis]SJZ94851.1 hypothetical protein SAMN05428963_104152 [Consotaella salsifontis]
MSRSSAVLAVLALSLALSGCLSQINKPIRPGDRWGAKAETLDQAVPRD